MIIVDSRILKKLLQSRMAQASSEQGTSRAGACGWQVVEGFHWRLLPAQWKEHVDE